MVWTVPKMEIRELRGSTQFQQTQSRPGFVEFEAICVGFDSGEGESTFMFVRATDATRALAPADIIPCQDVEVEETQGDDGEVLQSIRFKASIHQRDGGGYHLIGTCAAEEPHPGTGVLVNNACVHELALEIEPLSPEQLEVERKRAAASSNQ